MTAQPDALITVCWDEIPANHTRPAHLLHVDVRELCPLVQRYVHGGPWPTLGTLMACDYYTLGDCDKAGHHVRCAFHDTIEHMHWQVALAGWTHQGNGVYQQLPAKRPLTLTRKRQPKRRQAA